jgi:beta-lactamase regulating signal transducer with metallopeptidase domain
MDMDEKKQKEQQLEETAQKKNLVIMKSKNGYMLVDYYTSRIVAGQDYSYSLDDAERFLAGY